jgi:hypothetical protein
MSIELVDNISKNGDLLEETTILSFELVSDPNYHLLDN